MTLRGVSFWAVAYLSASFAHGGTALADSSPPLDALDPAKAGIAATFVPIKAGSFQMGEINKHTVTLTHDFEMQATPVTQLQYLLVMGKNPSAFHRARHCDEHNSQKVNG